MREVHAFGGLKDSKLMFLFILTCSILLLFQFWTVPFRESIFRQQSYCSNDFDSCGCLQPVRALEKKAPELVHVQQSFILLKDFDHDKLYCCPANDVVNHATCSF